MANVGCPDLRADWLGALSVHCPSQLRVREPVADTLSGHLRGRFLVRRSTHHHRPSDPRDLVGERDPGDLGRPSRHQLDELAATRGPEYDRLFLTYMIQHHNGAVDMVDVLFATDGAAQDDFVFKLASDIQADQTSEVARMQRMLDELSNFPR